MNEDALPQAKMELCSERTTFSEMMFRLREIGRECVIPAIVEEYDRATHMATIKPIVQYSKDTVGGSVDYDRPTYKNIRVMQMRHGGYMIDWPINAGDTGILIAVDRSWNKVAEENANDDEFKNKGSGPADDYSLATFENGIFIPDSWVSDKGSDYENDDTLVVRGLKKDCSIDLIIDDPGNTKKYLKKFSVRYDGLYLDDKPFTGGGSSGGTDVWPFRYNKDTHYINNCYALVGRSMYYASSINIGENYTGGIYFIIDHTNYINCSMSKEYKQNTDFITCIKIYQFRNGEITEDYRGVPSIPLYE